MPGNRKLRCIIESYMDYSKNQEAPEAFHYWSIVGVISALMSRHCYFSGIKPLYCNMYIILVAESGLCRKSTALNYAYGLLEDMGDNVCNVLKEKVTKAYLYKHLGDIAKQGENAEVLLYVPELSTMLGSDAIHSGLISTLTHHYDCPGVVENRTKTQGMDIIRNVAVSLAGATTLDWMSNAMPGESVEGGFTSRVLFIVQDSPRARISRPHVTKEEQVLRELLIEELQQVAMLKGEFTESPESYEVFDPWYQAIAKNEDARLGGYVSRKGDHATKLAMIICAARSNSMVISGADMNEAITRLENIEKLMKHAFRGVAYSKETQHTDRVLRAIEKNGGSILHSVLLRRLTSKLTGRELRDVIDTLISAELIEREMDGRKQRYNLTAEGRKG